ncbi:MAG: rhamnulose-1-phosphate aldolase [Lachnospiraceae bacterium]|nr:rhamnulose-1-phosphate aldolase [Lachnospiraceae bacterium]
MKVLESRFLIDFVNMVQEGYEQGWHERNGGNLTYRIKPHEVEAIKDRLYDRGEWTPIGASVPDLAGEYFLVTGTGRYFRNVPIDPEVNLGIIVIDETGENYKVVWGYADGGRPTSELPSHLLNHQVKKRVTNGRHRIIYHAHTTNVIALSFILPLKDEIFTRELWEMMTECPVVFPEGIGVIEWMVPGGKEIGIRSSELMEKYNVIVWAMHGMFASGETFDETFGLMHTVEKAAELLIKVMSTGNMKRQTITPQDFRDLAKAFHITLDERFLYEKDENGHMPGVY